MGLSHLGHALGHARFRAHLQPSCPVTGTSSCDAYSPNNLVQQTLWHHKVSGKLLIGYTNKVDPKVWSAWRGGRVVYGSGLENQRVSNGTVGSNPTLSVSEHKKVRSITGPFCCFSSLLATIIPVIWSSEKPPGSDPPDAAEAAQTRSLLKSPKQSIKSCRIHWCWWCQSSYQWLRIQK